MPFRNMEIFALSSLISLLRINRKFVLSGARLKCVLLDFWSCDIPCSKSWHTHVTHIRLRWKSCLCGQLLFWIACTPHLFMFTRDLVVWNHIVQSQFADLNVGTETSSFWGTYQSVRKKHNCIWSLFFLSQWRTLAPGNHAKWDCINEFYFNSSVSVYTCPPKMLASFAGCLMQVICFCVWWTEMGPTVWCRQGVANLLVMPECQSCLDEICW